MGENITFSDWSQKLENGTNHWLPAYGFQQPGNMQDRQFEILNDDNGTQQTFLFLETILEETSDDLRSDSDYSGPTGWPDSDSDTSSVIHIAEKLNATLRNADWGGSERDLVVPKKRRRRQLLNSDPGVHDDDDDDNDDDFNMNRRARSQSRSRSRTKRRRGGARRKAGTANGAATKKKATRSRKPAHPDSDPENEDETSGMLSNDEDMSNVMVRTRNPAALLKEFISKELDLHETTSQTVAKYEDAVANLLYRSNTITAVLPDGALVEFNIRPKTGAGSNVASGVGQGMGPADLSAIQVRVEEFENLKNLLESGGQIPPEYSTLVMTQLTPEHQTMLKAKREATLAFLEVEAKLLDQETILRRSLTMAQADFRPALAAIDTVMKLDIRPLTLKKYPEVVNTFRKLQNYNVSELKARLPAPYQATFENTAALVRNGADFVMEKFSSLFEFSDDISFYEAFYHELVAFIEETRGVPVGDIMLLTD
uniref:Lens epithelium-derived growth factor integrase-binding domain-containing protein n=1 Tax=Cacopsylla melanoneura TaxID=428564 RepID=A0A8D8QUQ2_9HEMI